MPLWWVSISAFRPEDDIFRFLSPLSTWTFIPNRFTFEHIVTLWTSPFARAIFNSLFVAVCTVAGGLVVCTMAAFALAVIEFPGRNLVFTIMIVSFLIPFDAIAVPLYNVMRGFGLQNTYLGLILPGIGNGLDRVPAAPVLPRPARATCARPAWSTAWAISRSSGASTCRSRCRR